LPINQHLPRRLVSNMDFIFISSIWCKLFILFGTKLRMSTAYQPITDEQNEALNGSLKKRTLESDTLGKSFDKEQSVFEKPVEKYLNKRSFITLLKGKSLKWST